MDYKLKRLTRCGSKQSPREGQSIVEVALVIALIALVGIAALSDLGGEAMIVYESAACGAAGGLFAPWNCPPPPALCFHAVIPEGLIYMNDRGQCHAAP